LLAVIVGLVVCQIGIFCTTLYLHRSVAHKSVVYSPTLRVIFRTLIWLTTGIQPRQWAAVHRRHHAFTDVEGDPHSPLLLGFWKVQLGNAVLYRRCARDGTTVDKYAKDLQPDKLDKYIFSHAFVGLGIGIAILCVSLGWQYGLLAAGVHFVSYLL
jgi:stearoyl-CoA desaturase (delta-9 desaturase)